MTRLSSWNLALLRVVQSTGYVLVTIFTTAVEVLIIRITDKGYKMEIKGYLWQNPGFFVTLL